jgi:NAD(P)-dependent dehydrogenase (short-subunit alcohol dehydrogenase family)
MRANNTASVIAVTGGAAGIGAATVRLLAARGDNVIALDRDVGGGEALATEVHCTFFPVDVAEKASVQAAFAALEQRFGRLDGLVNSAGIESKSLIDTITEEGWDRVIDVNLKGTMLCTQAALPLLRLSGGGSIVNVASIAGKRISYSGDAIYTASKGGVLGFTRHAAFELAIDKIRVNAICPGPTRTPMIERNLSAERMAAVAQTVPLGRWVEASDVAEAIAFFLGEGASMCTGTSLDVDGGVLVSNGSRYADYFAARR